MTRLDVQVPGEEVYPSSPSSLAFNKDPHRGIFVIRCLSLSYCMVGQSKHSLEWYMS